MPEAPKIVLPKAPGIWFPEGLDRFGEDQYGVWLDLPAGDQVQRFRWIKPGEFLMGSLESEAGRSHDEGPRHLVRMPLGFWIANTPCTVGYWYEWLGLPDWLLPGPRTSEAIQHPQVYVSWDEIQEALPTLRQRFAGTDWQLGLPTEAQWEYAARAGSQSAYWFGPVWSDKYGNAGGKQGGTTEVMRYEPNSFGLHDVHGNVSEWCDGPYHEFAYGSNESVHTSNQPDVGRRALRGGSWIDPPSQVRAAYRHGFLGSNGFEFVGFRLALARIEPSPT